MNREQAIFQLDELGVHVRELIDEIDQGRYDEDGDLSYEVAVAHLLDHLAMAWHYARLSNEQIDAITQADFERLTNAVPDLMPGRTIVDPYDDQI
ncbi:MAG: hypothetical protein ACE37H_01560 [Phycisphaeraceae bacterium]